MKCHLTSTRKAWSTESLSHWVASVWPHCDAHRHTNRNAENQMIWHHSFFLPYRGIFNSYTSVCTFLHICIRTDSSAVQRVINSVHCSCQKTFYMKEQQERCHCLIGKARPEKAALYMQLIRCLDSIYCRCSCLLQHSICCHTSYIYGHHSPLPCHLGISLHFISLK